MKMFLDRFLRQVSMRELLNNHEKTDHYPGGGPCRLTDTRNLSVLVGRRAGTRELEESCSDHKSAKSRGGILRTGCYGCR